MASEGSTESPEQTNGYFSTKKEEEKKEREKKPQSLWTD